MTRPRLNQRERVLAGLVVLLLLSGATFRYVLLPSYRIWQTARAAGADRAVELSRLSRNVTLKAEVDRQYAALPPETWDADADAISLARFLTQLETLARESGVVTTAIRPEDPQRGPVARVYQVRLSVAGRMPDLLGFMAKVTGGPTPTGIESLTLRASQGGDTVECTVVLVSVRLEGGGARPPPAKTPLHTSGEGQVTVAGEVAP